MMLLTKLTTWAVRISKDSIMEDHQDSIREVICCRAKVGDSIQGIISTKEVHLIGLLANRIESHKKSIDATIRNLEVHVGQLVKQIVERPTGTFGANTEMNTKEECKVIFTRRESAKKEKKLRRMCVMRKEKRKKKGRKR